MTGSLSQEHHILLGLYMNIDPKMEHAIYDHCHQSELLPFETI